MSTNGNLPTQHPPADAGESGVFDFYVQQLETYLDGELDAAEAAVVRQRLSEEPAYAASLARLESSRRMRIDGFCAFGDNCNDDEAAQRLCKSASVLTTRETSTGQHASRHSTWWLGSAAAACVTVGLGIGFIAGGGGLDFGTSPADPQGNPLPSNVTPGLISDNGDRTGPPAEVDQTPDREQSPALSD